MNAIQRCSYERVIQLNFEDQLTLFRGAGHAQQITASPPDSKSIYTSAIIVRGKVVHNKNVPNEKMADMFCHKLIDASFFEYLISFWIINQIDVIFAIFAFEGAIRQESTH